MTLEDAKTLGVIGSLLVSTIALLLNFFSTLRSVSAQKTANFQEITKSHREIWKLTIDDYDKFKRVLQTDVNLLEEPVTYNEKRFIQLLLNHATSSFYFGKYSHMIEIEKISLDFNQFLSLPIPRKVWHDNRVFYNKEFVDFWSVKEN
ncbi:hypothetical protein [Thaumasiovibrio subtropicus]|uniref:hypothetical protein n=2 Tax=Thaumasiovibrio subtropicus TaxID=1891207 RepID=UPI001C842480|nr:hypothetical protein [Thaumasiovibrio subtropicus]